MRDKVFVTGANGFVGLNIVEQLLSEGYEVVAYVRPSSNIKFLADFPVTIKRGELTNFDQVCSAMAGYQFVIHTAGNTSCDERDLPELTLTNVTGTDTVVQAAIAMGVQRLVFTSTTSTIGAENHKQSEAGEQEPLTGFRSKSPYSRTKRKAEKIVLDAQNQGLETIILNLAEVVGGFDHNLQWGRMVLAVQHDQVPFMPPGGGTFCSAKQAALAHVKALSHGESGQRYIIGGANHDFQDFIQLIAKKLGRPVSATTGQYYWSRVKTWLHGIAPRVFTQKPLVDAYRLRVFGGHYFFNSAKAKQQLHYQAADLSDMVDESIQWYRHHGFI